MSKQWWSSTQTTQGHGIFSQYQPDHLKEWVARETRKQERSASPDKAFKDANSFHRSSLFMPIESQPLEHRHHATTKTLEELRLFQTAPPSGGHSTSTPTSPSRIVHQPLQDKAYLPHVSHHHHFGWNPPTPQAAIGSFESKNNFYKYGSAQKFNHSIQSKAALISTRKA